MKVLKPTTIPFPSNGQFIRNSTATYIEDGVLKTAIANEPRWQDGKLLLEQSKTNLLLRTQEFDNAYWSKTNLTVSSNSLLSPTGLNENVNKIVAHSAVSGRHVVFRSVTTTPSVSHCASIFAKAGEYNFIALSVMQSSNSDGVGFVFDLTNGSFNRLDSSVGYDNVSAEISLIGSGWYRCVVNFKNATATANTFIIAPSPTFTPTLDTSYVTASYTGDGTSGIYIWGAQLEVGEKSTSYIPAGSATLTRASEICIGNFSRSSTATYIDNAGVLQTAAVNVPRIEGNQLLIEEQGVNLKAGSEYFDNTTYWIPSAVSLTANQAGPDGLNTAMKVTETSATSVHSVDSMTSYSGLFTFSLFAKPAERSWIRLRLGESTKQVWFNLSTATIGTTGSQVVSSSIKTLASGWCRVSVTVNSSTVVTPFIAIATADGVESYLGVVSSGLFIFGAQVESNSSPTSYIPTTTTSASRSADVHSAGLVYTNATDVRPLWSSATTYSTGQIIRYNNTIYESLQSTNLNRQPDTSPTWWLSLGADNISAAFDGKVGSKTTAVDKLRMIVYPGSVIDAVGYLETNASVVNTSVLDVNRNLAYSNSTGFTEANIENWYDYFFVSPLADPATQVVHQGIPSLDPGLFIGIEMINPGTVEVGSVLTGYSTTIGKTQYGLKAGIVDYSKKESDEFGNVSIVERPYSKRMQGDVYVQNYDLNKVQRFLYSIRATPVLWMASDNPELAEVSYVYGFYKDFSTTISYPDVSMCNLDIEGLI